MFVQGWLDPAVVRRSRRILISSPPLSLLLLIFCWGVIHALSPWLTQLCKCFWLLCCINILFIPLRAQSVGDILEKSMWSENWQLWLYMKMTSTSLLAQRFFFLGEEGGGGGKRQCSVFLFKWTQVMVTVMEVYFIFHLVPSSLDTRMNLSIWQSTSRRINRPVHRGNIFLSH